MKILGPLNADEKPRWDEMIARRDNAQIEISELAELYRKARKPEQKTRWLEWWLGEQLLFDLLNETLGGRYKVELEDRSHAPGASKPGRPIEEYRAMLKERRRHRSLGVGLA